MGRQLHHVMHCVCHVMHCVLLCLSCDAMCVIVKTDVNYCFSHVTYMYMYVYTQMYMYIVDVVYTRHMTICHIFLTPLFPLQLSRLSLATSWI